jgi:hypothetical protein
MAVNEVIAESRLVSTLTGLAQVSMSSARGDKATEYAREAWQRSASVQSLLLRINAGYSLAWCLLQKGEPAGRLEAINLLMECCRLIETLRRNIRQEDLRIYQSINLIDYYNTLVRALVELSEYDPGQDARSKAFDIVERAKARSLVEAIAWKAAKEAEETSGFRLAGISAYSPDPREELPRAGLKAVVKMLREDLAGGQRRDEMESN